MLQIQDSKNIDDYLCDHQMTALYQLSKTTSDALEEMQGTIDTVVETKADNIIFNEDDNTIQLSAAGVPSRPHRC